MIFFRKCKIKKSIIDTFYLNDVKKKNSKHEENIFYKIRCKQFNLCDLNCVY